MRLFIAFSPSPPFWVSMQHFLVFLLEQVPLSWAFIQEPFGNFESRSRVLDTKRVNVLVCSHLTCRCCDYLRKALLKVLHHLSGGKACTRLAVTSHQHLYLISTCTCSALLLLSTHSLHISVPTVESLYTSLLYTGFRVYRSNFQRANRSLTNVSLYNGPALRRHILYRSTCNFEFGREKFVHCNGGTLCNRLNASASTHFNSFANIPTRCSHD